MPYNKGSLVETVFGKKCIIIGVKDMRNYDAGTENLYVCTDENGNLVGSYTDGVLGESAIRGRVSLFDEENKKLTGKKVKIRLKNGRLVEGEIVE